MFAFQTGWAGFRTVVLNKPMSASDFHSGYLHKHKDILFDSGENGLDRYWGRWNYFYASGFANKCLPILVSNYFVKLFWRTSILFVGNWYLCFWLLVTRVLGFKTRVDTSGATPAKLMTASFWLFALKFWEVVGTYEMSFCSKRNAALVALTILGGADTQTLLDGKKNWTLCTCRQGGCKTFLIFPSSWVLAPIRATWWNFHYLIF